MTHFSDGLRLGAASYTKSSTDLGYAFPNLAVKEFGSIDTALATGVVAKVTTTAAKLLTLGGSLVVGGVGVFDVARNAVITSTASATGVTFTLTGTDQYGETMTETITGPAVSATTSGVKAFKTITSVRASAAVSSLKLGSGTKIGLPYRLGDKGKMLGFFGDGKPETTLTLVAGLSTTGVSTAATADIRGTAKPNTAPNGTILFTAVMVVDHSTKETLYGVAQA